MNETMNHTTQRVGSPATARRSAPMARWLLAGCALLAALVSPTFALPGAGLAYAAVIGGNLIANPSVEVAASDDASQPADWTTLIWGDLKATASWIQGGDDGNRALQVQVTEVKGEGDAAWMSAPIDLKADAPVHVSARYRCTTKARLLLQVLGGGEIKPAWIAVGFATPTDAWTTIEADVVLPAWATQARVVFAINEIGTLTTDTYAVVALPPPPAPKDGLSNVFANGSFEQDGGNASKAPGWSFEVQGGFVASGSLPVGDAAAGNRSARIDVQAVTGEGDAKWWSDLTPVAQIGGDWMLELKWRATTKGLILLWERRLDGSATFRLLKWLRPPVNEDANVKMAWTDAKVAFALPADVDAIRVAFVLPLPGTFEVDDVVLQQAAVGGTPNGPLRVSFAVDSLDAKVDDVLSLLHQKNVRASVYLPSARIEAVGATTLQTLQTEEFAGQEIGIYGENPAAWVAGPSSIWRAIVIRSFARMRDADLHPHGFAPPDGLVDDQAIDAIDGREGYVRSLQAGSNYEPFDSLKVLVRNVTSSTDAATMQRWIEETRRHNGWLVLRYGGVGADGTIDVQRLGKDIDTMVAAGATIAPVGETLGWWTVPKPTPEPGIAGCSAAPGARSSTAAATLSWLLAVALGWALLRRTVRHTKV